MADDGYTPGDSVEISFGGDSDHWITNLKPLATGNIDAATGAVGSLLTVALNPQQWLKQNFAEWIIGGVLDLGQYVLGWILYVFATVASAIADAGGPLASPFRIVGDTFASVLGVEFVGEVSPGSEIRITGGIYGMALDVANAAGLAGPPAAAFAVLLLSTVLAVLAYVLYGIIKTYLPADSLEGSLEALK